MGSAITVLLDSHVLHWWSSDPTQLSPAATAAIVDADNLAVSAITWLELAWLARHERILLRVPIRAWLSGLAAEVRTVTITPAVAAAAVELPTAFPKDPADRLIFSTAVEQGWQLVTKDDRIRDFAGARSVVIW